MIGTRRTDTHRTAWPLGPVGAGLVALSLCSAPLAPAGAFECPEPQDLQSLGVLKETSAQTRRTANLLDSGDAGNRVPEIIAELRERHPGVRNAEIVNYLVTAYCPVVARLSGLSDAEKTARVDRFASQVSRLVDRR